MADGFSEMIVTANGFFKELAANNTKPFYEERKDFYVSEIKKPAELLADLLAEDVARITGVAHKPKLFRIHRDVRFSKDKTPYNAHLHLMWSQREEGKPAWFFGSSPEYLIVGVGVMGLQKERLTAYRAFVDKRGDELQPALDKARASVGAEVSDWGPEPLKRVPKPYDPEHPHGDLLKRKALAVSAPPRQDWQAHGLVPAVGATMEGLLPVWKLLNAL